LFTSSKFRRKSSDGSNQMVNNLEKKVGEKLIEIEKAETGGVRIHI
jgi:hypothetical protein